MKVTFLHAGATIASQQQRLTSGHAGEKAHHGHVDCRRNRAQKSDQKWLPANPRRWVVERFFAWIGRNPRLVKDFEATIDLARALLYAASVMLLVRRIARAS